MIEKLMNFSSTEELQITRNPEECKVVNHDNNDGQTGQQ